MGNDIGVGRRFAARPRLTRSSSARQFDHHGHAYSLAAAFLSPLQRSEIGALYRFYRRVDDLAYQHPENPRAYVELCSTMAGAGPIAFPRFRPLADPATQTLMHRCLVELVKAVVSGLDFKQPADQRALLRGAFCSAGIIGVMLVPLIGIPKERRARATAHAIDLGIAIYLTNTARDLAEGAALSRIGLPKDWFRVPLVAHQFTDKDQGAAVRVEQIVAQLLSLADVYYESGEAGLYFLPLRSRLVVAIASRTYQTIRRTVGDAGLAASASTAILAGPIHAVSVVAAATAVTLRSYVVREPTHDSLLHLGFADLLASIHRER